MKRFLLFVFSVIIMGIFLVACGGDKDDTQPNHVHSFDEWSLTNNPTCEVSGEKVRYCLCGERQAEVVAPLGHKYFNGHCELCGDTKDVYECNHKNTSVIPGKTSTCTENGLSEGSKCDDCGKIIVEQVELPKTSHTYTDEKDDSCDSCGFIRVIDCAHTNLVVLLGKKPTCTAQGLAEGKVCGDCEVIIVAQDIIPATGHEEFVISSNEPTCTKNGNTEGKLCTVCDEVLVKSEILPMLKHNYVNGICSACGDLEDKTPLEVSSVNVNKNLVMANSEVVFDAVTNKDSKYVTLTVVLYLNGEKLDTVSSVGSVTYLPTVTGRYDAEVSVSDGSSNVFTYYLKSCFDVKPHWSLEELKVSETSLSLGELLAFSSCLEGDSSDLSYSITVYKDGVLYSVNDGDIIEFYPNVAGTYYAIVTAMDSYGESQTLQSEDVCVNIDVDSNPILSVNHGTTLNIDELKGKEYSEVVVPSGKDIELVWNKLATDAYYKVVYFADDNDAVDSEGAVSDYTSNSYTIPSGNLIPGVEYGVDLFRYDSSGKRIGFVYFEFVVSGAESIKLENEFEIISPVESGEYANNDITIQWTKLNYASKYVLTLEYHCGKGYHEIESLEFDNNQSYYTVSEDVLRQGCWHRLRVYAYDSLGNEVYESIEFRINGDETIFGLSVPEISDGYFCEEWTDDMVSYPTYEDIVVTWTDIFAASYYSISVDSHYSAIDDPVLSNTTNIANNTFVIPINSLVSGCVYSVRVTAYCIDGHKKTSERAYFRVPYSDGSVLSGPEVISHELSKDENDPTCMIEQPLTFKWNPVSAATTYSIYWSEVGFEDWPDYELNGTALTTVTIPTDCIYAHAVGYTDFELKIVAKDRNGVTESSSYYIRILESTIEAAEVYSPALPTDDEGSLPSFNDEFTIYWNEVKEAVYYRVRISEFYDDGYDKIYDQNNITDTSFDIPFDELYEGGRFKLTVRAYDQYGNSNGSTYYFTVGDANHIGLSVDNWSPSYKAEYKYTYIETSSSWTAEPSDSWIKVDSEGGIGSYSLKVSVTENTSSFARSGCVTLTNADGGMAIFSITQAANGSSNEGAVRITSPNQGDTLEDDIMTVKWSCDYGYHYFGLVITDLTANKVAYAEDTIVAKYARIPSEYLEPGHMYLITVALYYDYSKRSEASIVIKVEGASDDTEDDGENTDSPSAPSLNYVSNNDGTCYVSGIGNYTGTSIVIPSVSPSGEKVVGIGESAFNGNTNITSVCFSENVTFIGMEAFANCTNLKTVVFPNSLVSIGNAAFWGCTSLTGIDVPSKVTLIDYAAFSHCSGLKEVRLPSSLKTICDYGFYKCSSISTVVFVGTAEQWIAVDKADTWSDESSISIVTFTEMSTPESGVSLEFTSYGNGECYVSGIGSYTGNVVSIPQYSQSGDLVVKIGANAFSGNANIVRVNIPANVTSIGNYAFYGCESLTTVNMQDTITHIGTGAFKECASISSIELPGGLTYLSDDTFYGCDSLSKIVFGDNITEIGDNCFYNCKSIVKISLPDKLKVIGNYAFAKCSSIGYAFIPDRVTTIGSGAFSETALLRLRLPYSVKSISANAFNSKFAFDIYYQGDENELKSVSKGTNWGGDYENIFYNISDYVVEFPFETVCLPISGRSVMLMPMYGYGKIKIYDVRTWTEVDITDVPDIAFEFDASEVFTVKSDGTISVSKEIDGVNVCDGGYGTMSISFAKNEGREFIAEYVPYCVVESESIFGDTENKAVFSQKEKEHIVYSLDLIFSAKYIKMPGFPDWNVGDDILNNIVNLSDNLSSIFKGNFNLELEDSKRVLAVFIKEYIANHTIDSDELIRTVAEAVPTFIDVALEYAKKIENAAKLPGNIKKAIDTIKAFSEAIKSGVASGDQLSEAIDSLTLLIDYGDFRAFANMSKKCITWMENCSSSLETAKYLLHTVKKVSLRILGYVKIADFGFDTFMYMAADYSVNVDILEKLRVQFEKNYDETDYEIRAINELISEYENKYVTAIKDLAADILAEGVEYFASKVPGFGVLLDLAKIYASQTSAPAKADLVEFLMFAYAMGGTMDVPFRIFTDGVRASSFDSLKKDVCLYLNMVIYANDLAIKVRDSDYPDIDKYEKNNTELMEALSSYIFEPIS